MEQQLFINLPSGERLKHLEASADSIVNEKYFQRLSDTELTAQRALFTNNALKIDDLEQQKKEVLDEFKEQLKPLKAVHKELAAELRTKYTEKEGRLFKFVDRSTRMVGFYDPSGQLIKSEPATSADLDQTTIFMQIQKEGTNN